MGCVVGLFVTAGVYFFETRPRAKAPPIYFSSANHNAELMLRVVNFHSDRENRKKHEAEEKRISEIKRLKDEIKDYRIKERRLGLN